MSVAHMLDSNICSFIMRERPRSLLERLQSAVEGQNSIVI
jgi:tRNA(fMet)-specific endonuclease VapC